PQRQVMSDSKSFQLPWQGLVALAAAVAGAVWYFAPLDTSRPTERSGQAMGTNQIQDVDARLWQDPLLAAQLHIASIEKGQKQCRHEEFHQLGALTQGMGTRDFWVLP